MLVTQNRFHVPQRMAFGNLHNLSNKPEVNLSETKPQIPIEQQLEKTQKELKDAKRGGNILGCSFLAACAVITGLMLNDKKTETKLQEKLGQTTALLSEATGGRINSNNLDVAIESRKADSVAKVVAKSAQKALEEANSLRKASGR